MVDTFFERRNPPQYDSLSESEPFRKSRKAANYFIPIHFFVWSNLDY